MRKARTWKTLAFALALAPVGAYAQQTSDLMPPLPQPPAGQRAALYPGQPAVQVVPQGMSAPMAAPGTGTTTEPQGRTGYDIYDTSSPVFGVSRSGISRASRSARVESDRIPETHTVERGDTLWDIAGYYFNNPWTWPKLWALNPSITNPHWIYPGDVVRLMNATAPRPAATPEPTHARAPVAADGVFLRQIGFVDHDELDSAGKIVGSKEEKIFLSTHDEVYVEMNKSHPMRVGERYTVYRPLDEVKHPVTHKKLGKTVEILGEAEVRTITDGKIARCRIADSLDPIERGYLVGPLRRQFKIVEPVPASQELIGVVVASLRPISYLSAENIVFLDQGKAEGVRLGYKFIVTRRGDGYQPVSAVTEAGPVDDRRFPREIIGDVMVIDLREHMSTAIVLHSTQEIFIGDRIETRVGR